MFKEMRIVAIIQARMGSSRLPGKVLKKLDDIPVLEHVVRRLSFSDLIDDIIVATSKKNKDDEIQNWGIKNGVKVFRGSETDVLNRFYNCSEKYIGDVICRITADCPLVDYKLIDLEIKELVKSKLDYVNFDTNQIPRGLNGEIFTKETLDIVHKNTKQNYYREHVTYYIYEKNEQEFDIKYIKPPEFLLKPDYRLTLDTEADYKLLEKIFT